ncbi:MAG: hypothetical protein SGILL_001745, partial [Bacillariaceae sp.]
TEGRDPRKQEKSNAFCFQLTQVMKEFKRYEDVPDRREPFTVGMLLALHEEVDGVPTANIDPALLDWFVIGIHAGLRRGEWAQDRNNYNTNKPELNIKGDPQAFQLRDFKFKGTTRRFISHEEVLKNPHKAVAVELCWRTQKNQENGAKKLFARNDKDKRLCPVTHAINIISRFDKLCGLNDKTTPIAVYRHEDHNDVRSITSADIELTMRSIAIKYYELDPVNDVEDIMKFSAHSLRVGACVILQSMGFATHQIQQILRWKSDSWMMYTRNLMTMAKKQNEALLEASIVPVV